MALADTLDIPAALDRLLESAEHEGLAPLELRVLLRLDAADATPPELAAAVHRPVPAVRRAIGRLVLLGLVRRDWRRPAPRPPILSMTAAGTRALRRVVRSLDSQDGASRAEPAGAGPPPRRAGRGH
jgi:DNA-binding MarR family transcriptional regulator